jgi:hypothetical protein
LFSYLAKLDSVHDDIPILFNQFDALRETLNNQAIVTKVVSDPKSKSLVPKICMKNAKTGENLAGMVNEMAIWKWRLLYRGLFTRWKDLLIGKVYKISLL